MAPSSGLRVSALAPIARAALGLALLAGATAPALATGCGGDMACVAWDASHGPCPSRDTALAAMTVGGCPDHHVVGIRSDGELVDGDACCYEVTQIPSNGFCGTGPVGAGPGQGPGPTTGTGSSACKDSIGGACGACVEPACCNELTACRLSAACVDCFNGGTSCADDVNAAIQADVVFGCMAAAQCPGDPCGVNAQPPPLCGAPPDSPSGGKCVMLGGQVLCNPVTNEGCDTSLGEVCDRGETGGFQCSPHGATNAICNGCGATGWCEPGHTCYGSLCTKLCCDQADCGTGVCSHDVPLALPPALGVCVQGTPPPGTGSSGVGGTGGSG
jgi:hypothetical protein